MFLLKKHIWANALHIPYTHEALNIQEEHISYFFARNNHSMTHNNDPMSIAQAEGSEGNPPGQMSIEMYFSQITQYLSFTAQQMTELRQSQSALEARVISLQRDTNRPDER